VNVRYYVDPQTDAPHIYGHGVSESEVEEVLEHPGEDFAGREGSRVAIGRTFAGRTLRVVYVPDPLPDSVFVIMPTNFRVSRCWLIGGADAGKMYDQAEQVSAGVG
jgi:hypothetical protein